MAEERKNNFDALRLFAAAAVVFGHAYHLSPTAEIPAAPPLFLYTAVQTVAVQIFFAVSGYLVCESWIRDPDALRFFARRGLRIFPGLCLVVVLAAALLGPYFTTVPLREYYHSPLTREYLHNIALQINYYLPGVFESNRYKGAVNGSLWSLPVEVAMYVILGVSFFLLRNRIIQAGIILTLIFGALFAVYFYGILGAHPPAAIVLYSQNIWDTIQLIPYFWIGVALRFFDLKHYLRAQTAAFVLGGCVLLSVPPIRNAVDPLLSPIAPVLSAVAIPYLSLTFGLRSSRLFRDIGRYGDFSYGVYLYGFPVQQAVAQILPQSNPYANFALSLPIAIAFGAVSWHAVERPMLKLKPKSPKPIHTAGSPQPQVAS
jgi:peptidoglycan/LPS O-acetylase OafA/YrhL